MPLFSLSKLPLSILMKYAPFWYINIYIFVHIGLLLTLCIEELLRCLNPLHCFVLTASIFSLGTIQFVDSWHQRPSTNNKTHLASINLYGADIYMHALIYSKCSLFMAFESMNACIEHERVVCTHLQRRLVSALTITNSQKWMR